MPPVIAAEDRAPPATAPTPLPDRPESVIYRSELKRATHNGRPGYLMGQLQPEAYRPRGAREGWLIQSVFPGDPGLCAPGCDLHPGDVILTGTPAGVGPLEAQDIVSVEVEGIGVLTNPVA